MLDYGIADGVLHHIVNFDYVVSNAYWIQHCEGNSGVSDSIPHDWHGCPHFKLLKEVEWNEVLYDHGRNPNETFDTVPVGFELLTDQNRLHVACQII